MRIRQERPLCEVDGCRKPRTYLKTTHPHCEMHKARFRRNGRFGLQDRSSHKLEKLPHAVDPFIREQFSRMIDMQIAEELRREGFLGATKWTVGYRRRKLGIRKYGRGDKRKHKAWIRQQAIRRYGSRCELCGYHLFVETHHIVPKHMGGPHEVDNLMVVCSNRHILLTRRYVKLSRRLEIPRTRLRIKQILHSVYPYLG